MDYTGQELKEHQSNETKNNLAISLIQKYKSVTIRHHQIDKLQGADLEDVQLSSLIK